MSLKKARVLSVIQYLGVTIPPNSVIEAEADLIRGFKDSVDPSPKAVGYCLNELESEVILLANQSVAEDLSTGEDGVNAGHNGLTQEANVSN